MKIYTKIVLSIESGAVIERECYEYSGPLAECISGGGSKQKSKQKSEQSSETGTKYNEDFITKARQFASDPSDPTYNPEYVAGKYTSVAPGGFDKLENSLYGTQSSKLKQAYDQATQQQREELAQSGGLNNPSQFLEGSVRSSLDRTYMQNIQQAARDAFQGRLGVETAEAGRRTGFDTSEATRQTGFNEDTASKLLDTWLKKIALAIESGRYSKGSGTSYGTGSTTSGQGGIGSSGGGGGDSGGAGALMSLFA